MKISEFLSENFQLLVVKFSIYLNRHVFVMHFPRLPLIQQFSDITNSKNGLVKILGQVNCKELRCPNISSIFNVSQKVVFLPCILLRRNKFANFYHGLMQNV